MDHHRDGLWGAECETGPWAGFIFSTLAGKEAWIKERKLDK
jgi:hypothetical protein